MKKRLENVRVAIKEVFASRKYIFIASIATLILYVFNATFLNWSLLFNVFSFKLLWNLLIGVAHTMHLFSVIVFIILSILGGIVIAMTVYVISRQMKFNAASSTGGILVSILAPGCSACALGLASLLGIGGVLAILPFKGLEINILALVLLLWSIMYMSKKITTVVCEMPAKK